MNIVDVVILAMLGLSVLWALYRGFVQSMLSVLTCLLSILLAYACAPLLTRPLLSNTGVTTQLATYSDAFSRVGDLELSLTPVPELTEANLERVVQAVGLPAPLDGVLRVNLKQRVFGAATVNDYVTSTIVAAIVDILSYVICFFVLCFIFSIVINFIRSVFHYPLLKHLDFLAATVCGVLRGLIVCYVVMTLAPVLKMAFPLDLIDEALSASRLMPIVSGDNMIITILNGHL